MPCHFLESSANVLNVGRGASFWIESHSTAKALLKPLQGWLGLCLRFRNLEFRRSGGFLLLVVFDGKSWTLTVSHLRRPPLTALGFGDYLAVHLQNFPVFLRRSEER